MAQLYYKYGTMNSGKSFEIIKVAHNYEEQGKGVLIYSPALSARGNIDRVGSRVGFEREAIPVNEETDMFESVQSQVLASGDKGIYCVLIDEAQFLKRHHILELTRVVDELNIPVMAFGLKNDFQNQLFEGSYNLLVQADKIEEIKTICWYCDRKATMVIRFRDGQPVNSGEQIQIGGNEDYKPVCRRCYNRAFQSATTTRLIRGSGSSEEHARLLLDSYRRLTGKELLEIDPQRSFMEQIDETSIVILSHDTNEDPVLNYGNCMAMKLWEMDAETFTATPSRLTAEPMERDERAAFLKKVSDQGYVDDYTGVRISSTGRRFYIMNATVWNLIDEAGAYKGQAASFSNYRHL